MTRRRILVIASWYPTPESPVAGSFVETQVEVLSRRHDVAVIAPHVGPWHVPVGRHPISAAVEAGTVPVIRPVFSGFLPGRGIGTPQACSRGVDSAYDTLRTEWGVPDMIHAHVVMPGGYAAAQLGRRIGRPVVLTEHSSPFAMHLRWPWQRSLVRKTLAMVDGYVAVSPALRDQILAFAPGLAIDVVGNIIDTGFFDVAADQSAVPGVDVTNHAEPVRPYRFASIALLSAQKGIDVLLRAARRLVDVGSPAFEIVVGGDGDQRQRLEILSRELGLGEMVRFVGLLDHEGVRQWLRWSDTFVLPSRHETFGVVLGEAMACGKPVISTLSGGPEFVVTSDTGLLVPVDEPATLADVMLTLMTGATKFDATTVRASVQRRFGPEAFLCRIEAVYARLAP